MTMRNRKNVIVAFVLVAVMLMAVGFAALTDNLIIAGEANANTSSAQSKWEEDIYFSSAKVLDGRDGTEDLTTGTSGTLDEASVGTSNNDHANYKVKSLAVKGEKAVFEFTIQNDHEDYDAKVTIDTGYPTSTNEDYFTVTYEYDGQPNADNFVVPAGGSKVVRVTVTLDRDPDTNLSAQFTLNLTATSVGE